MARILARSFAATPFPLWLPFRSPSSTMVYCRLLPHVFFKAAARGPTYMAAATAPFHLLFFTTCHMMILSLATAALMIAEGKPGKLCFSRGLVQCGSKPSLAFRRWPVTAAFCNFFFCAG